MRSMSWTWRLMLAFVASFGLSGAVRAEVANASFVKDSDHCGDEFGGPCVRIFGGASLAFSDDAMQVLSGAGVDASAGRQGSIDTLPSGSLRFSAEIISLGGVYDSDSRWFSTQTARFWGDLTLSAPGDELLERPGGAVTVRNFTIKLQDLAILASLVDASGVLVQSQIPLLTFASHEGVGGMQVVDGEHVALETFTGLAFTEPGLNLFTSMLGLSSNDKAALAGLTDFGTVRAYIGVNISNSPMPVPEPSTWALMMLGLGAMAWRARSAKGL